MTTNLLVNAAARTLAHRLKTYGLGKDATEVVALVQTIKDAMGNPDIQLDAEVVRQYLELSQSDKHIEARKDMEFTIERMNRG